MEKEILSVKKEKLKAQQKGDLREVADFCNYLGRLYSDRERFEEALHEYQQELELCLKIGNKTGTTLAHRCLGECLSEMSEYGKALVHLKSYLNLAEEADDMVELQRAWATLGRTYFMKGNLKKSEEAHRMALRLTDRVIGKVKDKEHKEMRCRAFLNLALIYDQKDDMKEGSQLYAKAIQLATKYNLKEDLYRCQSSLAAFYLKMGQLPQAIKLFDEAIASAKILKNKIFLCDVLLSKGHLLVNVGDYQGARHYFKQAYSTRTPVESDQERAISCLKLSTLVCKTLKTLVSARDTNEKLNLFDKLGDYFVDLKCFKTAVEYYEKELEVALELGKSKEALAPIYVSIAATLSDDNQKEKGLEFFQKEFDCRQGNAVEEIRTLLKIIEVKIDLKHEFADIEQLYEQALTLTVAANNVVLQKKVLKDYSVYLIQELEEEKAQEVETKLKSLPSCEEPEDEEMEEPGEISNAVDELALSDISDMSSDSDCDNDVEDDGLKRIPREKRPRRRKADIKMNDVGETPLHRACIAGNLKLVEKLIEKGHPMNPRDHCGWLPIHEAANHGFDAVVEYLVDHGASIDDRGGAKCEGLSPLHDACNNGFPAVIKLLVRKGANVTALDNNGNTPLDCLRSYRTRVDELSQEEERIYETLVKELEDTMKKVGYDFSAKNNLKRTRRDLVSPLKEAFGQNRSRSSPPTSPPRKLTARNQLDYDEPTGACADYKSTMTNLRRKPDPPSSRPASSRTKGSKIPALLDDEEYVNEDWLENDLGTRTFSKRPARDLYEMRGSSTSGTKSYNNSRRGSGGCLREDEDEITVTRDRRVAQVTIEDDFDQFNDNFEEMDFADLPDPVNSIASNTQLSKKRTDEPVTEKEPERKHIRVKLEDGAVLVILLPDSSKTISWLIEETVDRLYKKERKKPVLTLTAKDGALFSGDDLISDVISGDEVAAKIDSWEMPRMSQVYADRCQRKGKVALKDIEDDLKQAESKGSINWAKCSIPRDHFQAAVASFKSNETLTAIDLSFLHLPLIDPDQELFRVLPTLSALSELRVPCTGLSEPEFRVLSKLKLPVNHLDLSYNLLDDSTHCVESIVELLSNFILLKRLDLRDNHFTAAFFKSEALVKAVKASSLKCLIVDEGVADDEVIAVYGDLLQVNRPALLKCTATNIFSDLLK